MREIERGVKAAQPQRALLVGDERVLLETRSVRRKGGDDRRTRVDRPRGKVWPQRWTGEDRSIERIETRKGEIEQQVVIECEVRLGDLEANQSIGEDQRVSVEIDHLSIVCERGSIDAAGELNGNEGLLLLDGLIDEHANVLFDALRGNLPRLMLDEDASVQVQFEQRLLAVQRAVLVAPLERRAEAFALQPLLVVVVVLLLELVVEPSLLAFDEIERRIVVHPFRAHEQLFDQSLDVRMQLFAQCVRIVGLLAIVQSVDDVVLIL